MLIRMLADVVSVASPGSSEDGSAPIERRSTRVCFAEPKLPVAAAELPAATTARTAATAIQMIDLLLIVWFPFSLVPRGTWISRPQAHEPSCSSGTTASQVPGRGVTRRVDRWLLRPR